MMLTSELKFWLNLLSFPLGWSFEKGCSDLGLGSLCAGHFDKQWNDSNE